MIPNYQEITIDEWPSECEVPEVVKQMSARRIFLTDSFVVVFGDDTGGIPRIISVTRTPEIAQACSSDWDDDDDDSLSEQLFDHPVIVVENDGVSNSNIILGDLREYIIWRLTIPARHLDEFIRLLRDGMLYLNVYDCDVPKELAEYLYRWCEEVERKTSGGK